MLSLKTQNSKCTWHDDNDMQNSAQKKTERKKRIKVKLGPLRDFILPLCLFF